MRVFLKKRIKITGENNLIDSPKNKRNELLKYATVRIKGNNNHLKIGSPNFLRYTEIRIYGDNNTIIMPDGCFGKVKIEIKSSDCTVIVGDKSGFMGTEIQLWEKGSRVVIGNDCMIAKNTKIYCTDFHAIYHLPEKTPYNQGKEIIVGNHVWLGEGVALTKNTHLTDNIIVGINSTVTKDLTTPYAIYAGNPATLKKTDINWHSESYDLSIKSI